MKKTTLLLFTLWIANSFSNIFAQSNYDPDMVIRTSVLHKREMYKVVYMRRSASQNRIKVKYFAARGANGSSVADRYLKWSTGKNVICITSGGYMDNTYTPVGLCVDNGEIVNRTLKNFDGLVIVYATGGVVASNLNSGDLTLQGANIPVGKKFDVRNSAMDRSTFLNWSETEMATVFQTHLLVYKNQLEISSINSEQTKRERRFLAVGKDGNELVHAIVDSRAPVTLYEGARRTLDFLNSYKNLNVTYMINLDPGAQDVWFLYDEDGNLDNSIQGSRSLSEAANLLVYYYE